jgi:solute carrier family 35 protein C2
MVATQTHFVFLGLILVLTVSACGGLRWSLTQLLLKNRKMGLDNPVATIFWLAPASGIALAMISATWDNWFIVFGSRFFDGFGTTLRTCSLLLAPGIVAFAMVLSEFYILQRAGVVPMSIAGIAKEVSTITISAWVFGDELTPLNITGVAITICGIGLFTYHKYRKSVDSLVPLDAHGNPILPDDDEVTNVDENGNLYHLQSSENTPLNSGEYRTSVEETQDESMTAENSQELFNADMEGEEDADEVRSIRSSKVGV